MSPEEASEHFYRRGVNFGQPTLCSPDDPTMASDNSVGVLRGNGHIGVVGKVKALDYPTMRKS
uniref:Uncharacterized protein n=1 Tax=Arundo donax TaxID=35708 RepID=A0A0A9HD52_ARUDO